MSVVASIDDMRRPEKALTVCPLCLLFVHCVWPIVVVCSLFILTRLKHSSCYTWYSPLCLSCVFTCVNIGQLTSGVGNRRNGAKIK